MGKAADGEQVLALVDFMKQKKREACRVCHLPDEVRAQLRSASDKKIRRKDQLEWLREEIHAEITSGELDQHYSGRHDE